jgi:hypothetical protein
LRAGGASGGKRKPVAQGSPPASIILEEVRRWGCVAARVRRSLSWCQRCGSFILWPGNASRVRAFCGGREGGARHGRWRDTACAPHLKLLSKLRGHGGVRALRLAPAQSLKVKACRRDYDALKRVSGYHRCVPAGAPKRLLGARELQNLGRRVSRRHDVQEARDGLRDRFVYVGDCWSTDGMRRGRSGRGYASWAMSLAILRARSSGGNGRAGGRECGEPLAICSVGFGLSCEPAPLHFPATPQYLLELGP